ncbi:uncharacterized protein LOC135490801 isoform X2 [Lineus longissimus]|uniref:uncharacterized protein LOC135490801 isoform X2 n=1 Tax=Lineus longissimus TaxID=88925 RepID=UPI00315C7DFB
MVDAQGETLPPVLKEYLPEYEPKRSESRGPRHSLSKEPSRPVQRKESSGAASQPHPQPQGSQELPREKTNSSLRSQARHQSNQDAHNEKTYKYWQQIKNEEKETEHRHLQKKLALQRELIRAQDDYATKLREFEQSEQEKLRQSARDSKQAREEALLKICKESLESDRQKAKEVRAASQMKKVESPMPERRKSEPDSRRGSLRQEMLNVPGRRISTNEMLEPHSISPVPEGGGMPDDRTQEEDRSFVLTTEDFANLPWHHIQLYKLYGKKANDYLYPKMEHKTVTTINPKLRRQGGKSKKGRAGADVLWDTLREDSKLRLLKEDTNISQDLKVPDIAVLMDQSVIRRTQDTRHKVELMFRSSVNNEDRAKILSHNNPMPDFNNMEGDESIDRYLPSWAPDDDTSTERSYKKWIRPRLSALNETRIPSASSHSDLEENHRNVPAPANNVMVAMETVPRETKELDDEQEEGDLEEWDFMLVKKKPKPKQKKIHFVTERDLHCKGQFSKRVKEMESSKGIPTAFDGAKPKSETARDKESSPMDHYRGYPQSMSAPPLTQEEYLRKYTSTWEPLSLNALMEYKEVSRLSGQGDYRHGKTRMWSAATTS